MAKKFAALGALAGIVAVGATNSQADAAQLTPIQTGFATIEAVGIVDLTEAALEEATNFPFEDNFSSTYSILI